MKNKGKVFQLFLSLIGLGVFVRLLATSSFSPDEAKNFLLLFFLGLASEWLAIPLRTGWTTVSEAVYYASILTLGPIRGGLLAFACALGGYLAGTPRKKGKLAVPAILSGAAFVFFPVLAGGKIYTFLGAPSFFKTPMWTMMAVGLMALVFNLLNNGMAMAYIYFKENKNPFELWLLNQLDEQLLSFSFAMPFLGILLSILLARAPFSFLFFLPLVYAVREAMQSHTQLLANSRSTIEALTEVLDERDNSTYHHSLRVSWLAGMLARHIGLFEEDVEKIECAAKIHDLGKIAILDDVLKKAGPLTEEEFHHMKYHPVAGAVVAEKLGFCKEEAMMVKCHHEKFDGTGYPLGLKGEKIPLGARIIAVVDFFDALTSNRVYRKGMPIKEVLKMLEKNKGKHFDPNIVDAFLQMLNEKGEAFFVTALNAA
jgi:putative nucleotidyltransferase with HDIG domain